MNHRFKGVFMAASIRTADELAESLSKGDSTLYTKIVDKDSDNRSFMICLVIGIVLLIAHLLIQYDYYAVKIAKLTGNSVETTAKIISVDRYERKKRDRIKDIKRYGRHSKPDIFYDTVAVTDDGIRLKFQGESFYGNVGDEIDVRYVRDNPQNAYVAENPHSGIPGAITAALFLLVGVVILIKTWGIFRTIRLYNEVISRRLYLTVTQSDQFSSRMIKKKAIWTKVYIPCYTYTLPDGRVLVFEGHPQEEKPDTDPGSMQYEFRIYMVNPEDSNDGRYILADNRD
jgi:hypothetical protein